MALKRVIEKLEDVDEALRPLYKESNGKFVLDAEDDGRLTEFRENNRKLFNENEELKRKYAGIDPDEARKTLELSAKMKKKELIESGDFEKLIEAAIAPIRQEFGREIESLKSVNGKLSQEKKRLLLENNVSILAPKHGVLPYANKNVMADAHDVFSVNDKNQIVALDEDGAVKRDANGDAVTLDSWFKTLPKESPHYFATSSGSGLGETRQPLAAGQIQKGDNDAFVANLDGIAKGKVTVA